MRGPKRSPGEQRAPQGGCDERRGPQGQGDIGGGTGRAGAQSKDRCAQGRRWPGPDDGAQGAGQARLGLLGKTNPKRTWQCIRRTGGEVGQSFRAQRW